MRVQHNILAMNSYRNYTNNVSALGKNLEKLSSGYRINRAGDDAAGLAISEKMRAQIQGLNAAQKNVKDAISFVKTAEGAMQEIQDMLGRMKYLATQSANGTYENLVDREAIQDEVDQLKEEINRIADSANFNGIYMLNGGVGGDISGSSNIDSIVAELDDNGLGLKADDITVTFASKVTPETKNALAEALRKTTLTIETEEKSGTTGMVNQGETVKVSGLEALEGYVVKYGTADGGEAVFDGDITTGVGAGKLDMRQPVVFKVYARDGETLIAEINLGKMYDGFPLEDKSPGTSKVTFSALGKVGTMDTEGEGVRTTGKLEDFGIDSINFGKAVDLIDGAPVKVKYTTTDTDRILTVTVGSVEYSYTFGSTDSDASDIKGKTLTLTSSSGNGSITVNLTNEEDKLKIGWDQEEGIDEVTVGVYTAPQHGGVYRITMQIGDSAIDQLTIDIDSMTTDSLGVSKVEVSDAVSAKSAIDTVKTAINKVSSVRGNMGAYQNRLEHTANNLSVMAENIQDAESTIRDTDVAEEMMSYVKNNILVQSAQSMLAQANQVPQGVLQLLG